MRTRAQLAALLETSERGTRNVLDAAKVAGNIRVVFVSSVAAINCSRTPERLFAEDSEPEALAGTLGYSAVKRAAERLVASYVEVRASSFCQRGHLDRLCRTACPSSSSAPLRCMGPATPSW